MHNQNQPSFIQGLRNAKRILLQLRVKKVKEQEIQNIANTPIKQAGDDNDPLPSQFSKSQKYKEQPPSPDFKERTFILHNKINQIGQELFECHNECDTYQSIFNNLAQYYADNLPTIQMNQKLKKKSYELKEIIEQYRKKIDNNLQEINDDKKYQEEAKKIVKQHLWNYLVGEAQNAMENPHQKVKFRHNLNANEYLIVKDEKDEDQPKASLELRYGLLKKQVARKPMMKKSTMQQQQLRRPFYSSQLYSL